MPDPSVGRQRLRYVARMTRPLAVPVWTRVASDAEWTGAKWVSEEERADAILRLEPGGLVLEAEVVHTTTAGIAGETTDTESLGRHELEIAFDQIVSVTLHGRWWRPKIRIQTNRLQAFEGIPGAGRGLVSLRLKRRNWDLARRLITELEFARADLELWRATKLDGSDAAFLQSGGGEDGS